MSVRASVVACREIDEQYSLLESALSIAIPAGTPLFLTDAHPNSLWSAYLDGIQADRRQHYNCHACRNFIHRFGGLSTIDESGSSMPALWSFLPPAFFRQSVDALRSTVGASKVTGVFISADKTLGTPRTGDWTHLATSNPRPYATHPLTASQAMAEKVEDYKMLCHGLADYSRETVTQAVRVLKADAVYRSEKALCIAEWFLNLHEAIRNNPKAKRNLTWRAVALAPPGFCHVRSTMISTLLDDINSGLPFDDIARRWKDKMHPLQYQRPTAAPKAGAIQQAEELVAKLGVSQSLLRRYATLDDVLLKLWVPRPDTDHPKTDGVFGHLREKAEPQIELPAAMITWERFAATVLDSAQRMEIAVPVNGAFCGLITATDPDAPPIIQWDGLPGHPRNPVSWYYWHGGSSASQWGLSPGWASVSCVFPNPSKWQEPDKFKHQKNSIHFAIVGCVESRPAGPALFQEILKSEFHGIRAVIEAHSNSQIGKGDGGGTANGLTFDGTNEVRLRVHTAGGPANYIIDRW